MSESGWIRGDCPASKLSILDYGRYESPLSRRQGNCIEPAQLFKVLKERKRDTCECPAVSYGIIEAESSVDGQPVAMRRNQLVYHRPNLVEVEFSSRMRVEHGGMINMLTLAGKGSF